MQTKEIMTETEKENEVIAAIYARVSSYQQKFNYSIEEQIELCRERCRIMGWKVKYIFKDEAVSGATTERPMFQKMLERAEAGDFDVIVFWKLDRFCRSLVDLINIEKKLKECGVALHSVTEQIDTTTPVGRFNFRNLASAAELERDLIRERARMGMHALARKLLWPNKEPPFGYTKDKEGRLKIEEREARWVRWIFKRYLEVKSLTQLAYELNKLGVKTRKGKKWSVPSVKNVIDNEIYTGVYRVAGVEKKVEEYKIIEEELFSKVQEIREKFRYRKKGRTSNEERKLVTIERIFNEYLALLEKSDKSEESKIRIL